ncbi:MAG: hypothetical protein IT299_05020 [Dehalococcoidia bacterium]|nr:hypothetical protein [Dehalococcoidia bacterium]
MPSQAEHLRRADHDGHLVAQLTEAGEFQEWAIVVPAYRALHLVEAVFAASGIHHASHLARNRAVRTELPEIALPYVNLQNLSRIARYDVDRTIDASLVESALAEFTIIETTLAGRL